MRVVAQAKLGRSRVRTPDSTFAETVSGLYRAEIIHRGCLSMDSRRRRERARSRRPDRRSGATPPHDSPEAQLRRAMQQEDHMAQERRWSTRWPKLRLAMQVAAVVAVVMLAIGTALVISNLRAPGGTPATTAPSTTPTPSPSSSPLQTPMPAGWIAGPTVCIDKAEGFAVGVPDGWYANDAADGLPACRLFSPETVEIAGPDDLPDVPIRLDVATGDFGFASEDVVDRTEVTIADLPAERLLTEGPNGSHLTYLIGLDGTLPSEQNPDRFLYVTTRYGDDTFERDSAALEEVVSQFVVVGG